MQSWFASKGLPAVSNDWAALISGVVNKVQARVPSCPPSTSTTTEVPTTEAPTTTVLLTAVVHHDHGRDRRIVVCLPVS